MDRRNGEVEHIATIGGTFDVLHLGHKEYIRLAFENADRVLIFVTSDDYSDHDKLYSVRPYSFRVQQVISFVRDIGCENRCEIRCLNSLQQLEIDFIEVDDLRKNIKMAIVSPEYYNLFLRINYLREQLGMRSFLILVKPRKRDKKNSDISSSVLQEYII